MRGSQLHASVREMHAHTHTKMGTVMSRIDTLDCMRAAPISSSHPKQDEHSCKFVQIYMSRLRAHLKSRSTSMCT